MDLFDGIIIHVMVWKCILSCNLPKSVFTSLCRSVPLEAKLSDCQRNAQICFIPRFILSFCPQKRTFHLSKMIVVLLTSRTDCRRDRETSRLFCYLCSFIGFPSFRLCLFGVEVKIRHTCQGDEQQNAMTYTHRPLAEGFVNPKPSPCAWFVGPFPPTYHTD